MGIIDPAQIAEKYRNELKTKIANFETPLKVKGFIATDDKPSLSYANATKKAFEEIGFKYELKKVPRLSLESAILFANAEKETHGIFIYFPVFGNEEDKYLRNLVTPEKDIEAGSFFWTRKLSRNDRYAFENIQDKKALIPCTPLAIIKILSEVKSYGSGRKPLNDKTVTIFNRSEVIGRPLAVLMSHDGASVFSFDEHGPLLFKDGIPEETEYKRADALKLSDIVVTGVPNTKFKKISIKELKKNVICINFSTNQNFDKKVEDFALDFVPRVGPMTVTMCMRNAIRLYENFFHHHASAS
jgi:methylenetetrahydrofolate dehydrogenase (NAD+)